MPAACNKSNRLDAEIAVQFDPAKPAATAVPPDRELKFTVTNGVPEVLNRRAVVLMGGAVKPLPTLTPAVSTG